MIVGWTGHRPDLFRDPLAAAASVDAAARDLIAREQVDAFLVGGQRGVDTWAALAAMALGVPFTLILPVDVSQFTSGWTTHERALLEQTLAAAAEVRVAAGYSERNRQIATGADLLIVVWTRVGHGGTAETVGLARAAGTPVREILLDAAPTAGSAQGRGI
jgi:uncharacterized phage-like protein YoqJ